MTGKDSQEQEDAAEQGRAPAEWEDVHDGVVALAILDGTILLKNLDLEAPRDDMGFRLMRFALFIREMPDHQMSQTFEALIDRFGMHGIADMLKENPDM